MPYFTYSFGLRHEKSGFHDFVAAEAQKIINTQKQRTVATTQQAMYYAQFKDANILLTEYKALGNLYQAYVPCLSYAVEKRIGAFNGLPNGNSVLQYTNKPYNLNDNIKQLLHKYGYDITCFTQCYGHQLHRVLHQESLNLLDHIDILSSDSILYDHQEALIDFTIAMTNYNHENEIDKAMHIGDFCWALLDYGQAIAEGVVLGAYSAVIDLLIIHLKLP